MNSHDETYNILVNYVLDQGVRKPNRTGIDTIGIFGHQMRFNLRDGTIPLLTTKKMHTRSIIHEILWYLQGGDNIKYLQDNKVTIWDEWADKDGNLGPVYGYQWRRWPHAQIGRTEEGIQYSVDYIDQIANIVDKLKNNPNDRRMIVSAWNVGDLPNMALPPCHYTFQFYTKPLSTVERSRLFTKQYSSVDLLDGIRTMGPTDISIIMAEIDKRFDEANIPKHELTVLLNQRSCDVGLGVPFNIVQYSILLRMFCEVANMTPGELIWSGADVHVYVNHIEALKEQVQRIPFDAPQFKFARKIDSIDGFKYEDFVIEGYQSHPSIKMEVAV